MRYKILLCLGLIIIVLFAVDYTVGYRQSRILEEKIIHKKRVERLAYYLERTNIEGISYEPKDHRYIMKLGYANVRPDEDMWIMVFAVKVFVQVGTLWHEVSVIDMREKRGDYTVEKLNAPHVMKVSFKVPYKNYEELMQGYMHMKVKSISYIAADAIAKEDIVEKDEDMFIYVSTKKKRGRVETLLR